MHFKITDLVRKSGECLSAYGWMNLILSFKHTIYKCVGDAENKLIKSVLSTQEGVCPRSESSCGLKPELPRGSVKHKIQNFLI